MQLLFGLRPVAVVGKMIANGTPAAVLLIFVAICFRFLRDTL